jgi:hypothetical protein
MSLVVEPLRKTRLDDRSLSDTPLVEPIQDVSHSVLHYSVADITQLRDLLYGQEREVFGDRAYWKEDDRQFLEAWVMRYRINRRPTLTGDVSSQATAEHAQTVAAGLSGVRDVVTDLKYPHSNSPNSVPIVAPPISATP